MSALYMSALYMSALACITHNPTICAFYRRLVAEGKPKGRATARPLALVASMRKLLVVLNAMVRDGEEGDADMVAAGT